MVRIKVSQKIFTEDEVVSLTGICTDHLRKLAQNKHLGTIARTFRHPGDVTSDPGSEARHASQAYNNPAAIFTVNAMELPSVPSIVVSGRRGFYRRPPGVTSWRQFRPRKSGP